MTRTDGWTGKASRTSRVPSVEPSLTTRISRSAGKGTSISRRITAATVVDSLNTGTMIETRAGTDALVCRSRVGPAFEEKMRSFVSNRFDVLSRPRAPRQSVRC